MQTKYNDSIKLKNYQIFDLKYELNKQKNINNELHNRIQDISFISRRYTEEKLNYLKNKSYTGSFRVDYIDESQKTIGYLENGLERGNWYYYYSNGTVEKYVWEYVRIGAECCDGTTSSATGRGACSWHGGVCNWLYDYRRTEIK